MLKNPEPNMDEPLNRLETLTLQTVARLQLMSEEELLEFVDARERLVEEIKALQPTKSERDSYAEQVSRILQHDRAVTQRMEWFQQQNNAGMNKINVAKKQKSAYDADLVPDSVLFDKRK